MANGVAFARSSSLGRSVLIFPAGGNSAAPTAAQAATDVPKHKANSQHAATQAVILKSLQGEPE